MNPVAPAIEALEAFSSQISRGGRVLCADSEAARWLNTRGIEIDGLDLTARDLRLVSPKRETLDGVWLAEGLLPFSIEDAQRVIAAFFQALCPRTGVLFAIHSYAPEGFASMLRQNGFKVRLAAQNGSLQAVVAQRI